MKKLLLTTALISTIAFGAVTSFAQPDNLVTTINSENRYLTMINVLTPQPGQQDETIKQLQAGMENSMRHQPGFISANIHKSLNSDLVVVYAQWKDQKSVDDAVKVIQSGAAPEMAKAFTIAKADFHPYQVMSVHRSIENNQ